MDGIKDEQLTLQREAPASGEELTKLLLKAIAQIASGPEIMDQIAKLIASEKMNGQLAARWVNSHLPKEQLSAIQNLAIEVFGDEKVAIDWLCEPNLAANNQAPVDLLGTDEGFRKIENFLHRIEYGVLA